MNITEWLAAGRPIQKVMNLRGQVVDGPPLGGVGISCYCDTPKEMAASLSEQAAWYGVCPNCKTQRDALVAQTGGVYSASLGAFVGLGVDAPDAKKISAKPEATPQVYPTPQTSAPARAVTTTLKSAPTPKPGITTTSGATPMVSTKSAGSLSSLSSLVGTGAAVGSVIPGVGTAIGGTAGAILGLFGSGKSKCPGPYNYDPTTGGCVPKPGSFTVSTTPTSSACPPGSSYDPATGNCKVGGITGVVQRTLPGGATGYVDQQYTPTMAYGMQGFVPMTIPQTRLQCPAGYVLYGKQPGMEVCLPKGFLANKHRKWPKSPNPALSAQDMRTLNRIRTLQNKIKRVANTAGFTTKKR